MEKPDELSLKLKDIAKDARDWIKDFEQEQPANLCIDWDTFEGSAYLIMERIFKLWKKTKS
jgi:hypothetical protein